MDRGRGLREQLGAQQRPAEQDAQSGDEDGECATHAHLTPGDLTDH